MSGSVTTVVTGQVKHVETLTELSQKPDRDLWQEARQSFDRKNRPRKAKDEPAFDAFLQSTEKVDAARTTCQDVQKQADAKYTVKERSIKGRVILTSDFVRTCLDNLDAFIQLGNIAVAYGPESVSAGWMAISFVLKAVKSDETNCKLWAQAAEVMSRILLNCKIFARLYSSGATGRAATEGTQQLFLTIPKTYESILVFAWATKRQLDHNWVHRLGSAMNPFSEAVAASQGAFTQIKDFDEQMRNEASVAFQELQQASSVEIRDEVKLLTKLWKEREQSFNELASIAKRTEETSMRIEGKVDALSDKVLQSIKLTPEQLEQKWFEVNKSHLNPQDLSQRVLDQKYALKDKGTCEWIFEDAEYTAWHDTAVSDLLWLFAKGGYGKSVLMSNIIKTIQEAGSTQNHTSIVTFFFCVDAGTVDATHNIDRIKKDIIYALYKETKDDDELLVEANRLFVLKDKKQPSDAASGTKKDGKAQKPTANDGLPDLDDLLIGLARLLKRRLFIAIDALDECLGDVEDLFSAFDFWLKADGTDIKLLVSSRPEPHLITRLQSRRKIDVEMNTQLDVAKRTDAALAKIPGLDRSERKLVRARIIEKASGQFTYVNTATDFLRQPWDRPIENLLNRLQDNMDNLYQEALRNTDPRYIDLARRALSWTLLRKGSLDVVHFFDIYSKRYSFVNKVSARVKRTETGLEVPTDSPYAEGETAADTLRLAKELANEEAQRKAEEVEHYREQIGKAAGNMLIVNQHGFIEEKHQTVRECFMKLANPEMLDNPVSAPDEPAHQEHICAICHRDREVHRDFFISREQGHLEIALSLLENLNSSEFRSEFFYSPDSEADDEEDNGVVTSEEQDTANDVVGVESAVKAEEEVEGETNGGPAEEDQTAPVQAEASSDASEQVSQQAPSLNTVSGDMTQTGTEIAAPDSQDGTQAQEGPEVAVDPAAEGEAEDEAKEEEVKEDVIRCICGSTTARTPTVRCDSCDTWQHIHCFYWPREYIRTNKGHICTVCKPEDRSLDLEAAKERQRIFELPEPELANGDADSDSEDELEDQVDQTVPTAEEALEAPKSHLRYEIYNWAYHLKEAERAAGRESKKDSALWQQVWSEVVTFMTNRKRLSNWVKTVRAEAEAARFWFLTGDEPPIHVATALGLTWVVKKLIEASELPTETAPPLGELPIHFMGYDADMNSDIELLEVLLEHNDPSIRLPDTTAPQALFTLIKNDPDLPFIQALHRHGVDWSILNEGEYQWNVMNTVAAKGTHPEIVAFLCQEGKADANHADSDGDTPLHLLLSRLYTPLDMLKAFLEQNANVNAESHRSERPLLGAANNGELAAIKLLFEESIDPVEVNDQDIYGATVLHSAAVYGHTELLQYLVEKGADINGITFRGNTPFRHACTNVSDASALFLLQRLRSAGYTLEQIDLLNMNDRTPMRKACLYGHVSIVEDLMTIPGMRKRLDFADRRRAQTPVHVAAWKGHDKVVSILLANGADHLKLDKQKKLPLQLCYEAWASGSKGGHEATVLLLIEHDTAAAVDDSGLLLAAATVGSTKVIRRLLELGSNLNIQDKHGWSPLQITRHLGHIEAAALLEHGLVSGQRPTCLLPLWPNGTRPSPDPTILRKYYTEGSICFLSDHPIPAGVREYYFEVELRGGSGYSLGFTTHPGNKNWRSWMPGWPWSGVQSYGFHTDGELASSPMRSSSSGRRFPSLSQGDIVGCHINFEEKTMSFAVNGQWLGVAFENVSGRLYPAVAMWGDESAFKVNLGLDPDSPFLRAGRHDLVPGFDRVVSGERLPTRLLAPNPAVLDLGEGRFTCEDDSLRSALLANHPIPASLETYYFEVDVLACDLEQLWFVAIGLSTQATSVLDWTPGWPASGEAVDRRSYAYHGDDGNRFCWQQYAADAGGAWPTYATGDTVGCGIERPSGRIFFTKNSELLGHPFEDKVKEACLFPIVGLRGEVSVAVNLGLDEAKPFKWAEANEAAWRKPMLGSE